MAQQDAIKQTKPGTAARRQVTALCYDLVESTRLAVEMDPEDLRVLQRRFHEICSEAITQYGGTIGSYAGDGAMAYFGYPRAHEDDPERAIRAGLAILENCRKAAERGEPSDAKIALRVGIATGLVVAGEYPGDPRLSQGEVIGIAPNFAHKIQAVAERNTLVISGTTRALAADLFQCRAMPPVTIAGFDAPQPVWRVVRARRRRARAWSARHAAVTPLVSRDEELAVLQRRWDLAEAGQGQVVLISGEPGIGKSRLAAALRERLADRPHLPIVLQCSSQESDIAYHPVIRALEAAVGGPAISPDLILWRLGQRMNVPAEDLAAQAPYLAQLMDRRGDPTSQFPGMSADQVKQDTMEAMVALIERASRDRPVLLLMEDIHWIDPTSEELLGLLIERVARLPVLVLATYRPEYQARWVGLPHVTLLTLNRLSGEQAGMIVSFLARDRAVSPEALNRVVGLSDGVPLFLEELSRSAFGNGSIPAAARAEPAIPISLTDFLASRLDQLGADREIAQVCSVIGRSFDAALVGSLTGDAAADVTAALENLVAAGLATARGRGAQAVYTFRHALIQESAYRSLLREKRQAAHRRLAEILAADHAGESGGAPEILAYHYEQAGAAGEAIAQLHLAARNAVLRSANVEAVRLLDRALRLLAALPENAERDLTELGLLVSLGSPRLSISGPGAPDVQALYSRAVALCDRLPNSPHHFAAHWGWWFTSRDNREALERANRLSALAEQIGDPELILQAHHCQWAIQYCLGDHTRTLEHIDSGLALYERGDFRHHSTLYGGHDPKSCGLGERAFSLWLTGHYDQSLVAIEQAVAHAAALNQAGSIRHSLDQQIMFHRFRGDAAKVLELAEETGRYAEEHGFKGLAAQTKVFRCWAAAVLGTGPANLDALTAGLAEHIEVNTPEDLPMYYEMAAEAYGAQGEPASGLPLIEEALIVAERSALRMWTAELHRRKGVLLMQMTPENRTEAAACFERAAAVARVQGARALLLRALTDRLRIAEGDERAAARRDLADLCDSLTEGHDFTDVVKARRLLDAQG